jgi:hypothetical protein
VYPSAFLSHSVGSSADPSFYVNSGTGGWMAEYVSQETSANIRSNNMEAPRTRSPQNHAAVPPSRSTECPHADVDVTVFETAIPHKTGGLPPSVPRATGGWHSTACGRADGCERRLDVPPLGAPDRDFSPITRLERSNRRLALQRVPYPWARTERYVPANFPAAADR